MKKLAILIFATLSACTSITVQSVDPSIGIFYVCIKENPKVLVGDFLSVVQDGFDRHGIATEIYSGPIPNKCEYILTYTALRSWDMAPYLSHAEFYLKKNGLQVASAEYHLNGKGGLSLMKWQGTKTKIDPIIDELLNGSPR